MSWSSPASILEKIIAYEAVHEIMGWDDLKRRLDPRDRRCFAFFHPALVDEPLIFVEVALGSDIPASIQTLLEEEAAEDFADPAVAVFYSISNCQEGLRGISFGNFLIKQVVEELTKEVPSLRTFVTLSPVPGFRSWLFRALGCGELPYLSEAQENELTNCVTKAGARMRLIRMRSSRPFWRRPQIISSGRRIAQAGRSIPWRASTLGMEQGSNGSIGWATPPKKVCARP